MASLQELLVAKRERLRDEPIYLPVPGFADEALRIAYRPVHDWASLRDVVLSDNPNAEAEAAARVLVSACQAVEGKDETGIYRQLPSKLGKALTDELAAAGAEELGGAENDVQAVFLLFGGSEQVMTTYLQFKQRSAEHRERSDQVVLGESRAS